MKGFGWLLIPVFAVLCAMNLLVVAGALRLGWTHGAMLWTLPVVGVLVAWVVWTARHWRRPGVEWDETPENHGVVGHDGIHGFGLPEGVVLRWEDVVKAQVLYLKGAPMFVLVRSKEHAVWVAMGALGEPGWLRELLGTRLVEDRWEPMEDAPSLPMPFGASVVIGAVLLMPLAIWCGEIFFRTAWPETVAWDGKKSSFGASLGVLLPIGLVLADRVTRPAGLAYMALLLASLPLAGHLSPKAADWLARDGFPVWQMVVLGVATACYIHEWRTGEKPKA